MRLDPAVDQADVDVLATVTNNSGTDYPHANIQFVSGNVQRITPPEAMAAAKVLGHVTAQVTSDTYEVGEVAMRQPLLEFYLYTVSKPTSLLKNETKQYTLFAAQSVPVQQTFEVGYSSPTDDAAGDGETPLGVETYVGFADKGPKLGVPLPAGIIHIYKDDATGVAQFVGEASIDRTPRLGYVTLDLGQSSDISAKHVQTAFSQTYATPAPSPNRLVIQPHGYLITHTTERIAISNAKTKPVKVDVHVQMPPGWRIESETAQHESVSSSLVRWSLGVPASGSTVLTYSLRVEAIDR